MNRATSRESPAFPQELEAELLELGELMDGQHDSDTAGRRVQLLEGMLTRLAPGAFARFRALLQESLGEAYLALPTGDRLTNLQRAIDCYEQALRVLTAQADRKDYISTQISLAFAFSQLPTGDRSANLRRAIDSYEQVLKVVTPEDDPETYRTTQTNLGNLFAALAPGDRSANQRRAIECYEQALRVVTRDSPGDHAWIQSALGKVYRQLEAGDRSMNLRGAAACEWTRSLHLIDLCWSPASREKSNG